MLFPKLDEARAKRRALSADLKALFDEAGTDDEGNVTLDKVKSVSGGKDAVLDVIRQKNAALEELAAEIKGLEEIAKAVGNADLAESGDGVQPSDRHKSFGAAFTDSSAYTQRDARTTAHLDVDVRNTLFQTSAGWEPESLRTGDVDLSPEPRLSVLNFVPTVPTSQSSVKFMRETTFDDSLVAEKAEGGTYGEAALVLTEQSLPVEKIPVWLPITDEQLEDEAQVEAYVNGRLVYMVRKRLNTQIIQGTGVTPLLEGTESLAGRQTQALGTDPIPDAIYKLFVKIQDDTDGTTSGGDGDPSALFIRPSKWQDVRLLRDANGNYIYGPPSQAGPMQIWGVPVVTTNAVTSTKAVTGDYFAHSYLAVKRGVDVQVTNAHSTFFIEGKQAIRADLRVAMVHIRESAFGEVTGL